MNPGRLREQFYTPSWTMEEPGVGHWWSTQSLEETNVLSNIKNREHSFLK